MANKMAVDAASAMHHPLHINLAAQTQLFLSKVHSDNAHASVISSAQSTVHLLDALSNALSDPSLTLLIENTFRPILFDLCARWITQSLSEDQLVAICLLLEVHEELFPILYKLLDDPVLKEGPLAGCPQHSSDKRRVNRLLLAYYRLLQANRELPTQLLWPLSHVSAIVWDPDFDNGSRLLAMHCYALQSGMGEVERVKIEEDILGESCGVDCLLHYENALDGSSTDVDGWLLPVIEVKRVQTARVELATSTSNYFCDEPVMVSSDLSPFVVDIEGVLLLRSSSSSSTSSPLVRTPTTERNLRLLAHHLSLRVPVLLTSPPSSGKSILVSHLALQLFPEIQNQIVTVHLADTSLDPRSLIGSYVSSTTQAGTFEWKEGVLVRAMRQGKWIVFKDIDRASPEVLGVLKPLVESYGATKWIGGCAHLDVPSRGRITAQQSFAIFATRSLTPSRSGLFASPLFLGANKFSEVVVSSPTVEDLRTVFSAIFPKLAGPPTFAVIKLWEGIKALGSASSMRDVGLRELEKFCIRVDALLPNSFQYANNADTLEPMLSIVFPSTHFREQIFLEARDVFFGAAALTTAAQIYIDSVVRVVAEHLGLEPERREWLWKRWSPELKVERDVNDVVVGVRSGNTVLPARATRPGISLPVSRPFAMHKPAVLLMSRITTAISLGEPVLLTGETGTGKTSVITHLSSLLRRPLISLNLSHQTESSDLLGGFKPVDARVPASLLQERFLELFGLTFSRRKNEKFEVEVRKAVSDGKWKRTVGLWKESARLARERIRAKAGEPPVEVVEDRETQTPRKRRKVDGVLNTSEANWNAFEHDVGEFEIHHVLGKSKFAFDFVEGPLVKAVRNGEWVLLDEINLASSETLECISSLLQSATSSITLTEQGSLEPVPRHPDFRLFACMNPATDVGKKDLAPNIRCRFTEIDVPAPDADQDTLISIVTQYIGQVAVGDKAAILNVAEFYVAVKQLAESRTIADGSNHRPHYSMRTLARALTFAADIASTYSLRRALWEGCLMAFTMVLDGPSAEAVTVLAQKHILNGVRNPRSMLSKVPSAPSDGFVRFGPFYLEPGPLPVISVDEYIMTPSVEAKLVDLARIILTRRFPVLIEGPTSSGKTSSIEYLAKKTGHKFVRINNHEHTDIQEYLGSYVADPITGKLVFQDGLLVRALRNGDWIVLDELNLAPTDVLEALNRLLDDNRELVIPETQEVVRPHPHFMIFATQNPPGLYAGRKILSRAFRNRFLEVHFEDVPEAELETILCQRCAIAPSYGKKIVTVFRELQNRRQAGRVFESKSGFATLRDLFRWAGRDAMSYQELAENGYMLIAERTRRPDDKVAVKEVIEKVMGVQIDEASLYNLTDSSVDMQTFLGCPVPNDSPIIWTRAMQRLFVLLGRALRFNEPVLLVGETGCGKTSVCQVFASANDQHLHALNCHQGTETADLIGGLRPIRNRSSLEADVIRDASAMLRQVGELPDDVSVGFLTAELEKLRQSTSLDAEALVQLDYLRLRIGRLNAIFEWHNGPLVEAMVAGDVFLLDEISLADDSVLERLNSVLEPSRTMVLAEKGGDNANAIVASESFKLVATMNPGGDYGKKELSPALRNRFTEIWVPSVDNRVDLELIVGRLWKNGDLKAFTLPILDFVDWLCEAVGDRSLMNLRDVIAWVDFSDRAFVNGQNIPPSVIFHHAARMTYIDGFASLPQLSGYSKDGLLQLQSDAERKLQALIPVVNDFDTPTQTLDPSTFFQLGAFGIPRGVHTAPATVFNFGAPTTAHNATRVTRACQLPKPILLEGSPGVGKTSLVTALAMASGHSLCRINLSDQTDLADLFGSDLPVEGGRPGEFAWKNAEFLNALVEGHWVLLDEMNLAPQAVLEGLNSVLDHRGTVFIPELGRSFPRHADFRIFAAQNPLNQGSGRKGLPKSFLNRFTKVYVDELTATDLHLVCQHLFPDVDADLLRSMVTFNTRLSEEVTLKRSFGREGSPWEFNLRDVIRWGTCMARFGHGDPAMSMRTIYLQRFRDPDDRRRAHELYDQVFGTSTPFVTSNPTVFTSAQYCQVGLFQTTRKNLLPSPRAGRVLQMHLAALEAAGLCVNHSWLSILTGARDTGKSILVRLLANITGNDVRLLSLSSATEATDILGSFEQVDVDGRVIAVSCEVLKLAEQHLRTKEGSRARLHGMEVLRAISTSRTLSHDRSTLLGVLKGVLSELDTFYHSEVAAAHCVIQELSSGGPAQFEWFDGPLVDAMKNGHWLVMDGANLCNPSVLDRLNSVCETDGCLTLNERGHVNGSVVVIKPHPNFRLFMTVDPQYGELSRAMRNRGIEIGLTRSMTVNDELVISDFNRLPQMTELHIVEFDEIRRGVSVPSRDHSSTIVSSGLALPHDSGSSYLLDHLPAMFESRPCSTISWDAMLRVIGRTLVPFFKSRFLRFLRHLSPSDYSPVLSFLAEFPGVGVETLNKMRVHHSVTREVPLAFILVQPMMFLHSHEASAFKHVQDVCLRVLDLSSILVQAPPEIPSDVPWSSELHRTTHRDVLELFSRARAISAVIIQTSPVYDNDNKIVYDLAMDILRYTDRLLVAVSKPHFDYSLVYAVVDWLSSALVQCHAFFADVLVASEKLSETIAFSSGVGLSKLWSQFLLMPRQEFPDGVLQLNTQTRGAGVLQDARRRAFTLMSLRLTGNCEVAVVERLIQDRIQLQEIPEVEEALDLSVVDRTVLNTELGILAAEPDATLLKAFLELICDQSEIPLLRMVPYQELLWLIEGGKTEPDEIVPVIVRQQLRWLAEIWSPTKSVSDGLSSLLRPVNLIEQLKISDPTNSPMNVYAAYEQHIKRNARLVLLQCDIDTSRVKSLRLLLKKSLRMVSTAFRTSPSVKSGLHTKFEETRERFVREHMSISDGGPLSSRGELSTLGLAWLSLARMVLELAVPHVPIDPAAVRNCEHRFVEDRVSLISEQLAVHRQLEDLTTGNAASVASSYLQGQRDALTSAFGTKPTVIREDVSRLHMFWSEVSQFQTVVSPHKIDELLQQLEHGIPSAVAREESVQQTVHNFIQRLQTAYADFDDIGVIVQFALQHLRVGLRVLRHAYAEGHSPSLTEQFAAALTTFPSIGNVAFFMNSSSVPAGIDICQHHLIALSAVSFEVGADVTRQEHLRFVQDCYDRLVRLWLMDQENAKRLEDESQSLYRRKDSIYDDLSDEAREELEFRDLFPSFDDVFEDDSASAAASSSARSLVSDAQMTRLLDLHYSLVYGRRSSTETAMRDYYATRVESISSIPLQSLSGAIDEHRLFQLQLLARSSVRSAKHDSLPKNFYNDPNIDEIKKAVAVVNSLHRRLGQLIEEWPDQMVLHHLRERCDTFLLLKLNSPVAKVLAGLEQLLVQSEDWELFANRHNNLKPERSMLIELIVEWRRMELSCWDSLLDSEHVKFQGSISEWWFRLYDSLIRGSLDASARERDGEGSASDYLSTLLPMLDEFIRGSPLGQFTSRMKLIDSFEVYCHRIILADRSVEIAVIARVQSLLRSTRANFDLYTAAVDAHLREQRLSLEKEVKNFVKLASWKDINVQALKASALRTHHQLFKIIRKFRDILREPAAARILPQFSRKEEDQASEIILPDHSSLILPTFPSRQPPSESPHLVNLDKTYSRFVDISHSRLRAFISSALPVHIDSLTSDIISGVESLSSTQVPADLDTDKRTKFAKSVLTRKRKAWSDLLKELKRAGFATNVKPEILQQNQDRRWLREQPGISSSKTHLSPLVRRADNYFHRLEEGLRDLRASIASHHSDLTTRELQRGVMFLESCFGMAVESRARLSVVVEHSNTLEKLIRRLRMISSTSVASTGDCALQHILDVRNLLCQLLSALEETCSALAMLIDMEPQSYLDHLAKRTQDLRAQVHVALRSVVEVVESVKLTAFPVVLTLEAQTVAGALDLVEEAKSTIADMSKGYARTREIFSGLQQWLLEQTLPNVTPEAVSSNPVIDPDSVIDTCLVTVQTLLGKCAEPIGDAYDRDNYIRTDYHAVRDVTQSIGVFTIVGSLDRLLRATPHSAEHTALLRLLPFLDRYENLLDDQLTCHASWTKALFKMSHVLCSLLRTLSKDGFCKPPDLDEAGSGGDQNGAADGMGMGEGTGSENVSKDIEDESQVEGLKGEKNEEGNDVDKDDDNAIEMADDFGGDMQDVPENASDNDADESDESDEEHDEQIGDLEANDPDAVDEKLWGDEQGPDDSGPEEKTDKDHSEQQSKDSEVGAKEGADKSDQKEKKEQEQKDGEEAAEEIPEEQVDSEKNPEASGAPMEDHVPEADTLDLPDDMDLGLGDEPEGNEKEDAEMGEEQEEDQPDAVDDAEMQEVEDNFEGGKDEEGKPEDGEGQKDVEQDVDEGENDEGEGEPGRAEALPEEDDEMETPGEEDGVAPPDVRSGEDNMQSTEQQEEAERGENATGEAEGSSGAAGGDSAVEKPSDKNPSAPNMPPQNQDAVEKSQDAGDSGSGVQQGQQPQSEAPQGKSDPLRSLGDALKEARQTFNEILHNESAPDKPTQSDNAEQLEYIRPDDDEEMQALGPAEDEQTAKLKDLKLMDDEKEANEETPMDVDMDIPLEADPQQPLTAMKDQAKSADQERSQDSAEGAIVHHPTHQQPDAVNPDQSAPRGDIDMEETVLDEAVEVELRQWQAIGAPAEGAEHIWRMYESLTHDLAYALCEQLRLILEPTLATRLKGDYRTGKRLNMKKIIPYIASDYTKDKIWLRRTRPSQREYQILIALDDSRSMSESHSVHLAYQTMALVSKALTRLEAGDIGFAKFGQTVDILHGFTDGPFTDQTGTKVMSAFKFDQKATDVLSLVDRSLQVLERARETRMTSSSSAADLWQLEVIISDGICQDHEKLRSVLRKAEEQRVMIVFIIIDSLGAEQGSIFTMEKADFQNVDGRMELKLNRYLDTFPFEYYVVLRDVEALPGVLAATLKQFFERISEE